MPFIQPAPDAHCITCHKKLSVIVMLSWVSYKVWMQVYQANTTLVPCSNDGTKTI